MRTACTHRILATRRDTTLKIKLINVAIMQSGLSHGYYEKRGVGFSTQKTKGRLVEMLSVEQF